jgi:pyruvate formate lyase activating enzyme
MNRNREIMRSEYYHTAKYWHNIDNNIIQCELCPHECRIGIDKVGLCTVRKNQAGKLTATSYGNISSLALDPIEKKPLYMYKPGSRILSIGSYGCNFHCPFCQNYEISLEYKQRLNNVREMTPNDIRDIAFETQKDKNIGVAYTYNEPLINYEFVYDTSILIKEAGLDNILVTNGYICDKPLRELLPFINAMNIDLKSFSDDFYKKIGGDLETVKNTIKIAEQLCHVEVTTLVIPGENEDTIEELASWLAKVNPDIPLHLSRFFPRYRYIDKPPTPFDTMRRLKETAKKYRNNVYLGNI